MWYVSSRSGVATLRTAIHLLLTYLLTYGPRRLGDNDDESTRIRQKQNLQNCYGNTRYYARSFSSPRVYFCGRLNNGIWLCLL